MKPICIDANVFIASTKGNETYSSESRRVIEAVGNGEFYLIEPTIFLTEVIRNITKYMGMEAGKTQENNLSRMVSIWEICDDQFCTSAGYTGALYIKNKRAGRDRSLSSKRFSLVFESASSLFTSQLFYTNPINFKDLALIFISNIIHADPCVQASDSSKLS